MNEDTKGAGSGDSQFGSQRRDIVGQIGRRRIHA